MSKGYFRISTARAFVARHHATLNAGGYIMANGNGRYLVYTAEGEYRGWTTADVVDYLESERGEAFLKEEAR